MVIALIIGFNLLLILPSLIGVGIMMKNRIPPSTGEWEVTKCEGCGKTKKVHTGYGVCYPCLVDVDDE
jgi:Ribonuclease G/E